LDLSKIYVGVRQDFEGIVNDNKLAVYSTVLANLNRSGIAEVDDIVQETFIYAYYNFATLRDVTKLTGWLCGIARNKSRSFNKTRKNLEFIDDIGDAQEFVLPSVQSTEDSYIENYERGEIMRGINNLSDKLRETVILYYMGEKSTVEIAQILAIPEGTVRFRLADARKKLKKEFINIMSHEKKEIAANELYAKVQENIEKVYEHTRNNKNKEASDLCDETFKMIANYPSFSEMPVESGDEPKKLLYNLYHAKAAAMHLKENANRMEYLKKALEICEELATKTSDWGWLANEYYAYALDHSNNGQKADDMDYLAKAVEYAKKSGNKSIYATCLFWQANGDIANSLDKFEEIVAMKEDLSTDRHIYLYALSKGYCEILSAFEKAGIAIGKDENIEYASVCPGIKYEVNKVKLAGEPGSSSTCVDWALGAVIGDIFVNANLFDNGVFLDNNFREGYKNEGESWSYTYNNKKFVGEVISMSEEITVVGGTFKDCIHVRRTETLTDKGDESSAKLNKDTSGVSDIWFAPDVGIIKYTFEAISGNKEHLELSEYKINNTGETELIKKYLPIALGNTWKYAGFDKDGKAFADRYESENVFEVVYTSPKYNAISNWAYDYPKK